MPMNTGIKPWYGMWISPAQGQWRHRCGLVAEQSRRASTGQEPKHDWTDAMSILREKISSESHAHTHAHTNRNIRYNTNVQAPILTTSIMLAYMVILQHSPKTSDYATYALTSLR